MCLSQLKSDPFVLQIFWKSMHFIFLFLLSMSLFHQNYCFTIFDKHHTIDLIKNIYWDRLSSDHDATEEKENKIQGFSKKKKNPASWTRSSVPGEMDQINVEIHTLSDDLRMMPFSVSSQFAGPLSSDFFSLLNRWKNTRFFVSAENTYEISWWIFLKYTCKIWFM
jgi:hypothetical protein